MALWQISYLLHFCVLNKLCEVLFCLSSRLLMKVLNRNGPLGYITGQWPHPLGLVSQLLIQLHHPELHHLMISAAKAAFDLHIPVNLSSLVSMRFCRSLPLTDSGTCGRTLPSGHTRNLLEFYLAAFCCQSSPTPLEEKLRFPVAVLAPGGWILCGCCCWLVWCLNCALYHSSLPTNLCQEMRFVFRTKLIYLIFALCFSFWCN